MRKIAWFDWSKTAKHFLINSRKKFLGCYQARGPTGEQASGL